MFSVRKALLAGLVFAGLAFWAAPAHAAELLDCKTGCSFVDQFGLIWSTDPVQPAGTGVIDSFLRIQHTPDEEGMNTDYRPLSLDEKTDPNYTQAITLGEISQVVIDGQLYYELLLDINEPAPENDPTFKSYISLVGLELCYGSDNLQYVPSGGGCDGGGAATTAVYNLDGLNNGNGDNNEVQLDYSYLSTGSGGSDLFVYVPASFFTGLSADTYFYLWSQFGFIDGGAYKSQDGYEEWAARLTGYEPPEPLTPVPEPASLLLLGSGLAATAFGFRRSRRHRQIGAR